MSVKTRAEILKLAEREYAEVEGFRIQSLTELEIEELQGLWSERYGETKKLDLQTRRELLVRVIVDENGDRIFKDDEIGLLAGIRGKVLMKVHAKARELSGFDLGDDDEKN